MTSRRRFAAGFAALVALTGTLVFGGAIVANADAVINFGGATPAQGSTSIWTATAYVLEGTTTNTDYTQTIDVVDYSSGSPNPLCTGLDPQTGSWSCSVPLSAGFKDIRVFQAANSDTRTFSLNPPAPTIDQADGIVVPFGEPVTFTGANTWTGGYIGVNVVERAITCSDTDVSGGTWSCEVGLDDDPIAGTFTLRVYHQAQGTSSAFTEITFTVADFQITSPAQDAVIEVDDTAGIVVSGVTPDTGAGLPIEVRLDEASAPFCTIDPAVSPWSCAPLGVTLEPGDHYFTAAQYSENTTVDFTVPVPSPTVTSADPLEVPHAGTATVTGTSEYNGYARVSIPALGPGFECYGLVDEVTREWTCDIEFDSEPGGEYQVEVILDDESIAPAPPTTFTLVLGEAPPATPIIDAPLDEAELTWDDGDWLTVSGRAPAGLLVNVELDGAAVCSELNPDFNAEWTCSFSAPVGAHEIVAVQDGIESDPVDITVDYPAPEVTTDPSLVAAAGSQAEYSGFITYPGVTVFVTTDPFIDSCDLDTSDSGVGASWDCLLDVGSAATDYTVVVTQRLGGTDVGAPWNGILQVVETVLITSPADGATFEWSPAGVDVSGTTPSSADPVALRVDGELVCEDLAPTATWVCADVDIAPGVHTLTAQQDGLPDHTIEIEVLVPEPDVAQAGYAYVEGTDYAVFSGASTYPGLDLHVDIEIGVENYRGCDVVTDTENWSCQIYIGDLDVDTYPVAIFQEGEGVGTSLIVDRTLEILEPGTIAPPLNCVFSPAGITISSPYDVTKDVYRLTPWTEGGGASSGGSGGEGDGGYTLGDQGYCNGSAGYLDPSVTTWDDGGAPIADGACDYAVCTLSGLPAGIYEVYHTLSDGDVDAQGLGYSYEPHDYLFRIPETPGENPVASTTNSVLLSGTATAGDLIRVERDTGTALCSTTVSTAGTWACVFPKSSDSIARTIASDPQSGGLSAYTAFRDIPVFVAPEIPVTPTPVPTLAPPVVDPPLVDPPASLVQWLLTFGGDLSNLKPGDSFTLNVSGMPEGTEIEIWMHSTPRLIGTATGTGAPMTLELTVPDDIDSGPHEIEMIGVTPLGTQYFFTSDAMVTGGTLPAEPLKDEPVLEERGTSGSRGDRADPGAPSGISDGLAPLSAIAANPATVAIAGGLALALLFLVALPTELLNSSLSSNTSRLGRVYGAIDGGMTKAQDWLIAVTRSRATAAGILVVLIAFIYGFVDPNFGFDIVSLRLVLSLAIALFVLTFVASWISGMIIRRAWGAMGVVAMQPSILLFAVVGVVVARILEFSPGFLIGVAIGLELLQASKTVIAKAVFVQLGVVTGLALAAWVVYSFFTPGDDFVGMLVEDTLVAVTAEGLTGALIAVFPLKFLDGRELWEVSKRLWVAAFLIVSTAFALLVLPTATEGTDVADYGVWLLVFAVFGLVSLAVWIIFVRADKKAAAAEPEKVDA